MLFTFHSASYSDVDENGVIHMMLCRVIMGNVELIHPGSQQFEPSGENFDSGVDNLQKPKHYIIWDMNRNTHIYPEYVVTIKVPSRPKGFCKLYFFIDFWSSFVIPKLSSEMFY